MPHKIFSCFSAKASSLHWKSSREHRNRVRVRVRVRLLLSRWGILCHPLFENESPPFSWSGLLPTMRRMELSGELVAGRFFAGINSLQFASPAIAIAIATSIGDAIHNGFQGHILKAPQLPYSSALVIA